MMWLVNVALTEIVTALIVWVLIERFGHVAKTKGKLRSFSVFLIVWAMAVALHIYVMSPSERLNAFASESLKETANGISSKDIATLAANKPELQSIIRQVLMGGALDQQTHDHFWSLIPASLWSTPDRRQDTLAALDEGIQFQRAFWQSVLLSAQTHQVVKTEAYEQALQQVDPSAAAKSEAMLQAAASGAPYTLSSGQGTLIINEAYAHQVISNLEASSARLKNLNDPEWHQ